MKTLSKSPQILILLPIFVVIISTIYVYRLVTNTARNSSVELPKIQGVILKSAQQLADTRLTDHQGQAVNRDYFLGKWHFIAYGYTQCPDICPTTLFTLVQLADLLSTSHEKIDTQFIFYTVDPDRDSQEILSQYIHYFSDKFVAVRANTSINAEIFQHSLGIKVYITNGYINDDDKQTIKVEQTVKVKNNEPPYQVDHGLAIFLINPEAELQAVFFPEITERGMKNFTSDVLYRDYLKVIEYYKQRSLLLDKISD